MCEHFNSLRDSVDVVVRRRPSTNLPWSYVSRSREVLPVLCCRNVLQERGAIEQTVRNLFLLVAGVSHPDRASTTSEQYEQRGPKPKPKPKPKPN